jgi:hypothetical protein
MVKPGKLESLDIASLLRGAWNPATGMHAMRRPFLGGAHQTGRSVSFVTV